MRDFVNSEKNKILFFKKGKKKKEKIYIAFK